MIGVVAVDCTGGIGKNGNLPWKFEEDMLRFKALTTSCDIKGTQNCIIMGRKTWDNIKYTLPNRFNIVVSKSLSDLSFKSGDENNSFVYKDKPHFIAKSKEDVLEWITKNKDKIDKTFVIGGKEIYNLFFDKIERFELTILKDDYNCDTKLDLSKIYNKFKIKSVFPENNHTNLSLILITD